MKGKAVLVSVVVPCYRSASTLPRLVEDLMQVLPGATTGFEIVLVVDGSPDDTWQVASQLANKYPQARALRLARNYGQHNALIAGVRNARYEVVVTMDDDLQHPADQVPLLLRALTDDIDLVYGVPAEEEHGVVRSFSSRLVKGAMASTLSVQATRSRSAPSGPSAPSCGTGSTGSTGRTPRSTWRCPGRPRGSRRPRCGWRTAPRASRTTRPGC